jgi:hypothetical protein
MCLELAKNTHLKPFNSFVFFVSVLKHLSLDEINMLNFDRGRKVLAPLLSANPGLISQRILKHGNVCFING